VPVPTLRDPAETRAGLTAWLAGAMPGAEAVAVTLLPSPPSTGYSCETVLFDGTWACQGRPMAGAYAARIHPSGYSLYQEHDLDRQWRVMEAVRTHSDVPVPRVVGHETAGTSRLGQPFFVMERIEGVAPADSPPYSMRGGLFDASPASRRLASRRALELWARIDRLDWHGRVLTADALLCQRRRCQRVLDAGGDYVLVVKENQPTLFADLQLLFDPPSPAPR